MGERGRVARLKLERLAAAAGFLCLPLGRICEFRVQEDGEEGEGRLRACVRAWGLGGQIVNGTRLEEVTLGVAER